MSSILITGVSGTIGTPLRYKLLQDAHIVYGLDIKHSDQQLDMDSITYRRIDIRNYRKLEEYINLIKPDYIYHLAAEFGRINGNEWYEDCISTNLIGTQHILELQRKYQFKLIFASSSEVYGESNSDLNEDLTLQSPIIHHNTYAASKMFNEHEIIRYQKRYGTQTQILRFFNCFAGDTDVMTPNGIKNIKDFKVGDYVYTLNPETHNIEVTKVSQIQKEPHNGQMVNINTKRVDFSVTNDHNMYLSKGKSNSFSFVKAVDLLDNGSQYYFAKHNALDCGDEPQYFDLFDYIDDDSELIIKTKDAEKFNIIDKMDKCPTNGNYNGWLYVYRKDADFITTDMKKYFLVKDFFRASEAKPFIFESKYFLSLLGWYISEGNTICNQYGQVVISQNTLGYREEIFDLLMKMNLKPSWGYKNISFSSKCIKNFLEKECGIGCKNKKIPHIVHTLSLRMRTIIYQSLMDGDGDASGRRYSTSSKQLRDDFCQLAFGLGLHVSVSYDGCYRINLLDRSYTIKSKSISTTQYTDKYVYCITAEDNHIIYAGRNGKMSWVGQCYGPGEFYNPYRSVVCIFCYRLMNYLPITIYKNYHRVFMYIDDFINTLSKICIDFKAGTVYNIGGSEYRSVEEMANMIIDYLIERGYDEDRLRSCLRFMPEDQHNIVNKRPDIAKVCRDYNHINHTSLTDGIHKTIDWMLETYRR